METGAFLQDWTKFHSRMAFFFLGEECFLSTFFSSSKEEFFLRERNLLEPDLDLVEMSSFP